MEGSRLSDCADTNLVLGSGDLTVPSITLVVSCQFCRGAHSVSEACDRHRCDACGSSVTAMGVDTFDNKVVRRCFRCNTVAIW